MSTFSIFIALIIVVCFLLVLVVMVQNPKGGGLSSSFGGGTQQVEVYGRISGNDIFISNQRGSLTRQRAV